MSTGVKRGALSISAAFGLNWQAITKFNVDGQQPNVIEVFDVAEDPQWSAGYEFIYAIIRVSDQSGPLWLLETTDMGGGSGLG